MLNTFFLTCAVVGGAIVLTELLLTILAAGFGHGLHFRHHPGGGAIAHRGPVGGRVGMHRPAMHRAPGMHRAGLGPRALPRTAPVAHAATAQARLPAANTHAHVVAAAGAEHWAIAWLHSMLNFQGIVAGATVLGLAGLASTAANIPAAFALLIAIVAGFFMMFSVAGFFQAISRMDNDGTLQVENAVGEVGTVYLSIPARNAGQGKISVTVQQRLMEFPAVTFQDAPLAAGDKVLVVAVQKPATMEVVSAGKFLADTRQQ